MLEVEYNWPWQYNFPPFFTLQPHTETRTKQISTWKTLVLDYYKTTKQSVLDVREATQQPLFNNSNINRKLNAEFILSILSDMRRTQNAAPIDKTKNRWEIYWHTLEEWGNIIYSYVNSTGGTNSILTLFELAQGEDDQTEFYGLDINILIKALKILEKQGKCELILSDDQQGVKFF